MKGKSSERNKEKKATRPVRKVQKLTSPESKQGDCFCCRGRIVTCPSEISFVSRKKNRSVLL